MDHLVEPKAAATNAQRAGDIVTREGQPHVYLPTPQGVQTLGGMRVWMPPPLEEMNEETSVWQMLVPQPETVCDVFGENDTLSLFGWASDRVDPQGDYVWNLWRPYECCQIRGIFLTTVDFAS
jgi:integrating conjugative element protein (TIGR03756 family)